MGAVKSIVAMISLLLVSGVLGQTAQEWGELQKLPRLRTSIYGKQLMGGREFEAVTAGKSGAEVDKAFRAAAHPVRMGESFQLTVELVRPDGTTQVVSGDPRTKYAAIDCMIISSSGFVTVTMAQMKDSGSCAPGIPVQLWIQVDDNKKTGGWDSYVFMLVQ